MENGLPRRVEWVAVAAIAMVGLLLRLPRLLESLWFDELWSTQLYLAPKVMLSNTLLHSVHPPFHELFMSVWTALLGDGEVVLRAPSLLYGVGSVIIAYHLAASWLGKRASLVIALLMWLSPVHIWYSTEARSYAGALFWLLLFLLAFERLAAERRRGLWWWLYVLSGLAIVLTHFYLLAYVIVVSLFCLHRSVPGKGRILMANGGFAAVLLLFVGLKSLLAPIATGVSGYLRSFGLAELWLLFFNWFACGNTLWADAGFASWSGNPAVALFQIVFCATVLAGLARLLRGRDGPRHSLRPVAYLLAIPGLLLILALLGFRHTYIERSAYVVLPFFLLLAAQGMFRLRRQPLVAAGLVFLLGVQLVSSIQLWRRADEATIYKPRPDWREAARYLGQELDRSAEDAVIFVSSISMPLSYYDARIHYTNRNMVAAQEHQHTLQRLEDLLGSDNILARLLRPNEAESRRLDLREIPSPHMEIEAPYPLDERLPALLVQYDVFYVLSNLHWPGPMAEQQAQLRRLLERDVRFELVEERAFRGIQASKYRTVFRRGQKRPIPAHPR